MPRKKQTTPKSQTSFIEPTPKTAPCVPAIRRAVDEWRLKDYAGVSDTTRILLNFWFKTDHRLPNGRKFAYHKSQREAIETLIYLYEVAGGRRHKTLVENYATPLLSPRGRGDRGGYDLRLRQDRDELGMLIYGYKFRPVLH